VVVCVVCLTISAWAVLSLCLMWLISRVCHGTAFRFYSRGFWEKEMEPYEPPEMLVKPLEQVHTSHAHTWTEGCTCPEGNG
jgi:type II secretory pathway component PulL